MVFYDFSDFTFTVESSVVPNFQYKVDLQVPITTIDLWKTVGTRIQNTYQ